MKLILIFNLLIQAFVIYCFFNLLVNYLGGERSLLILLHGRPPTPHLFPVNIFVKEMDIGDPYAFLFVKRGILQYVYLKPIITVLTMILKYSENYGEGHIEINNGYIWISLIYNVSCSLCFYCLIIFYVIGPSRDHIVIFSQYVFKDSFYFCLLYSNYFKKSNLFFIF